MNLLLDQNLSRFLVPRLAESFPGSTHVVAVGLDRATDREIWDWAGVHGFTVISKDSDFRDLASVLGTPPKAIWLRVGNSSTELIERVIRSHVDVVMEFGHNTEEALLVISID